MLTGTVTGPKTTAGEENRSRLTPCVDLYKDYMNHEWGHPTFDDRHLFEMLILEGAQAGLNWSTILNKRENYRKAYANFDVDKVASFTEKDKARLLEDAGLVRNRLKINSSVKNAQVVKRLREEHGSFAKYLWSFVDHKPIVNKWKSTKDIPAVTPESEALSSALKSLGCSFVGPTIMCAYMQAVGMVNDHLYQSPQWHSALARWLAHEQDQTSSKTKRRRV
mmetsp:Transcript_28023/g.66399  ORF Transcript_28023/g.66399 Transcript_28023/m.66399 type:complete len:222 (-) Transcript_28023:74-739(-)